MDSQTTQIKEKGIVLNENAPPRKEKITEHPRGNRKGKILELNIPALIVQNLMRLIL